MVSKHYLLSPMLAVKLKNQSKFNRPLALKENEESNRNITKIGGTAEKLVKLFRPKQ